MPTDNEMLAWTTLCRHFYRQRCRCLSVACCDAFLLFRPRHFFLLNLVNSNKILLFLSFSDWFETKLNSVWFQINRGNGKYNPIWVALSRTISRILREFLGANLGGISCAPDVSTQSTFKILLNLTRFSKGIRNYIIIK